MPFMDHFLEEVVTKRNNTVNRIIYYFSWVIMMARLKVAMATIICSD